ncbi:hypothetical protein, partial [Rhizobium laguerreae]|uniref:hypothetical protein n=1 Tax=Rhizobium laguerreae TaxID=1076926 RepID=UPI0019810D5D
MAGVKEADNIRKLIASRRNRSRSLKPIAIWHNASRSSQEPVWLPSLEKRLKTWRKCRDDDGKIN